VMAKVSEADVVAVWRCAGCHCSTEVPVPKPTGRCPACGLYMWDDIRRPRPDPVISATLAALNRERFDEIASKTKVKEVR